MSTSELTDDQYVATRFAEHFLGKANFFEDDERKQAVEVIAISVASDETPECAANYGCSHSQPALLIEYVEKKGFSMGANVQGEPDHPLPRNTYLGLRTHYRVGSERGPFLAKPRQK